MKRSVTCSEVAYSPDVLAEELDYDFQEIADALPSRYKLCPSGIAQTVFVEPKVGRLESIYLGRHDKQLHLRLSIFADVELRLDGLGFYKDYNLVNHHLSIGGEPHTIEDTQPEDLRQLSPPQRKGLALLVKTIHDGYLYRGMPELTDIELPSAITALHRPGQSVAMTLQQAATSNQ